MSFIEIRDLHAEIDGKEIIKGINLKLEQGKVNALMGPNGSGKSTLSNVLMGSPEYLVTQGTILFDGQDITALEPDARARLGIFLSFQYPSEIPGVTISNFMRTAMNAVRVDEKKLSLVDFRKQLTDTMKLLHMDPDMMSRYLNEGFSGGEKKRAEILQLLMLNPKFAILDETDSGLDVDALRVVAEGVNHFLNKDKCVLIITHYKRILEYIKPDHVFIMTDGKIAMEGEGDLVDKLEDQGYGWITEA